MKALCTHHERKANALLDISDCATVGVKAVALAAKETP